MRFCISIKHARIISQLPQALENWLGLDLLQQIVIKIVEISLFRTWFAEYKVSIFFISFQFRPLCKAHKDNERIQLLPLLPSAEKVDGPTTVFCSNKRFRVSPEDLDTSIHIQVCQSQMCVGCFPRVRNFGHLPAKFTCLPVAPPSGVWSPPGPSVICGKR